MDHKISKGALDLRSPAQSRRRGKNYLLAIAINDYQHCRKLNNAVLDVERFIEVLERRYNFEKAQIFTLFNKEATRHNIINAFVELADIVEPEDNLVVYFSGHGRYHRRTKGYWVPVEGGAGDNDFSDYIKNGTVKSYLQDIQSLHTFLIVDSCFSGSLFIDRSREKFTGDRVDTEPSRWGLTSGKKEIVSDGRPGQHSPFAQALLDVLNKAVKPPTVVSIISQVLERVAANAIQTPMGSPLAIRGHRGGQFIFQFRAGKDQGQTAGKDKKNPNERNAQEQMLQNAKDKTQLAHFLNAATFPDLIKQATDRLNQLEDEEVWQEALEINTVSNYYSYIFRFKKGNHIKEAKAKIEELLKKGNSRNNENESVLDLNQNNKGTQFQITARTHEGKIRNHNEDNYIVSPSLDEDLWFFRNEKRYSLGEKGCLMVVADGDGGKRVGEVAAKIAITTAKKYFQQLKDFSDDNIENALKKVFLTAGTMMEIHAKKHPSAKEMETTLTVVWLRERTAHMAWVGNSRVYLLRKGKKIKQMNKDHSLVQQWIDEGRMSDEEAFYHPKNYILTRNMKASGEKPEPDYMKFEIMADDRILVCSDGLNGMLLDKEIDKIMEHEPENITYNALALEEAALKADGVDNITILLSYIHRV